MRAITTAVLLSLSFAAIAQNPSDKPTSKIALCDENAGCDHQFIDGQKFKMLTSDGLTVTVAMTEVGKYVRADVSVFNGTATNVDVLPTGFDLEEVTPKQKPLTQVDIAKLMRSAQARMAWANALTAMGAGMQRQQTTTNTTSNGTVNATASDGTYANGTYHGTSTATTSSPNYAAQAQADETIRQRNAALVNLNGQLSHVVLKANTAIPNQSVRGVVLFERDKKEESVMFSLPVGGTVYRFPFTFVRQ
jgi:hypothetical protein